MSGEWAYNAVTLLFYKQRKIKIEPRIKLNRLRVVSNFGDGDCGAGEIHTRARARNFEETRREGSCAPLASRLLQISRARMYFARPTSDRQN